MANLCNLNGAVLPESEARIPVLDRGFLFGDSIYEVIRTRGGRPFCWAEHLHRLRLSAERLGLGLDLDEREIMRRVVGLHEASHNPDSYVRIIVTRGTGTAPNIDLSYAGGPPCWLIMVRPLPQISGQPARVALIDRLRTDRRALDPAIKSGNYLNNVMGLAEAKAAGATDCVMCNHDGEVTEASTSNVFVVRGGAALTPPLEAGILAGITRDLVLQHCRAAGIPAHEVRLSRRDLLEADELFLTSTLRDVAPVVALDGRELNGGDAGPFTAALMRGFAAFCDDKLARDDSPRLQALLR